MPQATYQMQGNVGLMQTIWDTDYYWNIGIFLVNVKVSYT